MPPEAPEPGNADADYEPFLLSVPPIVGKVYLAAIFLLILGCCVHLRQSSLSARSNQANIQDIAQAVSRTEAAVPAITNAIRATAIMYERLDNRLRVLEAQRE